MLEAIIFPGICRADLLNVHVVHPAASATRTVVIAAAAVAGGLDLQGDGHANQESRMLLHQLGVDITTVGNPRFCAALDSCSLLPGSFTTFKTPLNGPKQRFLPTASSGFEAIRGWLVT